MGKEGRVDQEIKLIFVLVETNERAYPCMSTVANRRPFSLKHVIAPEFLAALIIAHFGSFVIYESTKLALGSLRAPGPGLFPFLAGCFVTILSTILLAVLSLGKVKPRREEWEGINWHKIALCFAALVAYSITLDFIGYLLGTFVLSAFLFLLMEKRGILLILGASSLISLGLYLLFKHMLLVQLPRGIIPF